MNKLFSCFSRISIIFLLIFLSSTQIFAQVDGVWVEKQLPDALPADRYYAVGENCLIFVGKTDSVVYAYDLYSHQWHELDQPTESAWLSQARSAGDVAIVYTDSLIVVYNALTQSFRNHKYEGTIINSTSSSAGKLSGCMENMAYFATDLNFYVYDGEEDQWHIHPISGLSSLTTKYAYENPGYILIHLKDDSEQEKILTFSTYTKEFFELNYNFDTGHEWLDYGFVVWDHDSGLPDDQKFFGCYSAVHGTWTEYKEPEYSIKSASTEAENLFPRTVFMFRVSTVVDFPDYNHKFYIFNTLYDVPVIVNRTTNDDYDLHTTSTGAQTAIISFINVNNNSLEILAYKSDTHTVTPFVSSDLFVKPNISWHNSGGVIYLGNDNDLVIGGYPEKGFMAYAPMPADYEINIHWERDVEARKDWGILLIEDKDADSVYIYSYNILDPDNLTHFITEWGNSSFIKVGYNNKVAAILATKNEGYNLFLYSPVFNNWTEKSSVLPSPVIKISGDLIYFIEPDNLQLSVFNGATNQILDLPFGRTGYTAFNYISEREKFLIIYTNDNKHVSYSAVTGTSNEIEVNYHELFRGDQYIGVSSNSSGILTYNALSDAFVNLEPDVERGTIMNISVGGKTALMTTSKASLMAFDPYINSPTSIEDHSTLNNVNTPFYLDQNYPNPFNTSTSIRFSLSVPERVKIEVYNAQGHLVRTLLDDNLLAGPQEINFEAEGLPAGIYFYKMITGKFQRSRKMLLLK
jgi:Secretion system C-terminal sorting domain